MAGGSSGGGGSLGPIEGINVTPLVDIMLVLLVIFMVTQRVLEAPAVPLDLPPAARTSQVQTIFSVIIPARGPTIVDGLPIVDDTDLVRRARRGLAANPDLRAVIQADGSVQHRRVLGTLDLLRQAGVEKVAFGAKPDPEKRR